MKRIVVDIETIPQALERLEKAMPEEVRNPVPPPDPEEPNWAEKMPAYSLPELQKKLDAALVAKGEAEGTQLAEVPDEDTDAGTKKAILATRDRVLKARAAAADKAAAAQRAVDVAIGKRQKWLEESKADFAAKVARAREKFDEDAKDARLKFIDGAALDARLGHAKLIGLRDCESGLTEIFVWEDNATRVKKIRRWYEQLPSYAPDRVKFIAARRFRDRPFYVHDFRTEDAALRAFFKRWEEMMSPEVRFGGMSVTPATVTYYGNEFDFPFLYQRTWILGDPRTPRFRRGRYWDDARMIDLHDLWIFGDRQKKSGGLEALAQALGYQGGKTGDGKSFHEWYALDPVEGVVYLFGDLDLTEYAGQRMGVILEPVEPDDA